MSKAELRYINSSNDGSKVNSLLNVAVLTFQMCSTLPPYTSPSPPLYAKVREVTPFIFAALPPLKQYKKQFYTHSNTNNIDIISWQLPNYLLCGHILQPQNYLFPHTAVVIITNINTVKAHSLFCSLSMFTSTSITSCGPLPFSTLSVLAACG